MRERLLDLWDRRNGVWNAGVTAVACGVEASLPQGAWSRRIWIAIGILALAGGAITFIGQRRAARRSRQLADDATQSNRKDVLGSMDNNGGGDASEFGT